MTNASTPKLVTRQDLYDLAWQEPMLRVAERFGVSSSYLARVFTELRVPRPAPGYWAQREFGKSPPKPDLPPALPGDLTEWSPGSAVGTTVRTVAKAKRSANTVDSNNASVEAGDGCHTPHERVQGRRKRGDASRHELLTGVEEMFLKTRKLENGILRPYKRLLIDVMTSEARLEMALNAAQVLFQALGQRGFHVGFSPVGEHMQRAEVELLDKPIKRNFHRTIWAPERPTVVYLREVAIGLTLFEMTEEVEVVYVHGSYLPVRDLSETQLRRYTGSHHWRSKEEHPSGRFCLQAYCPGWRVKWTKRWQETKPGLFHELVPRIVSELETVAPQLARQLQEAKLRAEEESRQWDEDQQRRKSEGERLRREKAKQDSRLELIAAIASWNEAKGVLDYFATVEAELGRLPEEVAALVRERVSLAKELIGQVDPLNLLKSWKAPSER